MYAKMTSRNRLTLPRSIVEAVGSTEYFHVEVSNGRVVLTPVRFRRADHVRANLANLALVEEDTADAVKWARRSSAPKTPQK